MGRSKVDYISYLKIAGGLLMSSPLVYGFFRLDMTLKESLMITGTIYVICITVGIILFNYLEGK